MLFILTADLVPEVDLGRLHGGQILSRTVANLSSPCHNLTLRVVRTTGMFVMIGQGLDFFLVTLDKMSEIGDQLQGTTHHLGGDLPRRLEQLHRGPRALASRDRDPWRKFKPAEGRPVPDELLI